MNRKEYYNNKKTYKVSGGREVSILGLIPKHPGRVLDLGCGRGDLAKELKSRGWEVVGADISGDSLLEASAFLTESFCFNFEDELWPQELMSQQFDLIIASEVIEHVFSPEQLLSKLKNLLEVDGKVIITTPNFLFWKNRLSILFGKFQYQDQGLLDFGHIRFYTIKTARELFRDVGLKIQKEKHFYPNLYKRKLNFLGRLFPGLFAYQMIFLLFKS